MNPKTGTIRLRGVFDNSQQVFLPGYFARVRMAIGRPHKRFLVSEPALDTDQGQKIVYVVDDKNIVSTRPVQLGVLQERTARDHRWTEGRREGSRRGTATGSSRRDRGSEIGRHAKLCERKVAKSKTTLPAKS